MKKRALLNHESFAEFLGACFSCWFLAVGICLLIDAQFLEEFGVSVIICQCLIAIVLCAVFTRKWWIPIAIIVGSLAIFCFLSLVSKNFSAYGKAFISFIKWCSSGLKADSEFSTPSNINFAHLLANVGITALLFAVQRLTRKSWVLAFLSLGVIIVTYAFGFTQYNKIAILFFFVGVLTLMAIDEFNGHRLFKYGSLFNGIGYKWAINLISLVVCFAISAGTLALLNNDKELDIRNRFCSNIAADVQTSANFYTTEQQELDISLYDIGLQSSKNYLGGELPKLNSAILAETNLTKPTLLKITTFDKYNGKKWSNDFEKSYRLNGFWEDNQKSFLAGKIASNQDKYSILSNFYVEKDVQITLKESSYLLPTFEQTLGLSENSETKNPILFDARGRLISYFPQEKGFSYTLHSFSFDLTIPTVQQRLAITNLVKQPDYNYTKEFREHYTDLSIKLPENVIKDIENMGLKGRNPYYILQSVLSYFSYYNGFKYTEDGKDLPNHGEICSVFFKYKKGHCLYYSTAIISMLRYLDVPSRLAVGYRTTNNGKGVQVIDAAKPFCWVECYLPNIGWVTIDPTPLHLSSGGLLMQGGSTYEPPKKEEPKPEPPPQEEPEDEKEDVKEDDSDKEKKKPVNFALIFAYSGAALLIVYILLRGLWTPSVYKPKRIFRLFKKRRRRIKVYWRGISRQLKNLGYRSTKQTTLREYYNKIAPSLSPEENAVLLKAICICEDIFYSEKPFNEEDAAILYEAINMLELCYKRRNPFICYIKRCLRPLF